MLLIKVLARVAKVSGAVFTVFASVAIAMLPRPLWAYVMHREGQSERGGPEFLYMVRLPLTNEDFGKEEGFGAAQEFASWLTG